MRILNMDGYTQSIEDKPVQVLIADDHQVVRQGLRVEIEKQEDMLLVGEAANGYEVIELAEKLRPNIIVLDVQMPGLNGIQVIRRLNRLRKNRGWAPCILVFSAYRDKQYVWSLLAAGAKGYLLKSEPTEAVVAGIRQLAQGGVALSAAVQATLVEIISILNHELNAAEVEVLKLLAKGMTDEEIAETLHVTENTVKNRLNNTYRKVPLLRTRAEMVAWSWINQIPSE
jgi:NarL family two-component system response regulator LiaR